MNNDSDEYGGAVQRSTEYRVVVKKITPNETFDIPAAAVGVSIDWEGVPLSEDKYIIRYAVPVENSEVEE